jgi:hypothetical protein
VMRRDRGRVPSQSGSALAMRPDRCESAARRE